jgi:hypothetical protein
MYNHDHCHMRIWKYTTRDKQNIYKKQTQLVTTRFTLENLEWKNQASRIGYHLDKSSQVSLTPAHCDTLQ